jgi:hypothetical protein
MSLGDADIRPSWDLAVRNYTQVYGPQLTGGLHQRPGAHVAASVRSSGPKRTRPTSPRWITAAEQRCQSADHRNCRTAGETSANLVIVAA